VGAGVYQTISHLFPFEGVEADQLSARERIRKFIRKYYKTTENFITVYFTHAVSTNIKPSSMFLLCVGTIDSRKLKQYRYAVCIGIFTSMSHVFFSVVQSASKVVE